jgi:hypothetical protein
MKEFITVLFVTVALALAPALVMAQEDQGAGGKQPAMEQQKEKAAKVGTGKAGVGKHTKGARHDQRMVVKKELAEKAAAWNQSLNEKVAAMNAAQGDQKIAAMAAVINELVAQRNEMFEKFKSFHGMGPGGMEQMHGGKGCCQMMGGGKGGMHHGPGDMKGGMHGPGHGAGCPGMQGGGADTPAAAAPPAQ